MTFERLNRWDWVAFVAALALLFAMASDWYSTVAGEEARRIERIEDPNAAPSGQLGREVEQRAAERAEGAERNALQPQSTVDTVLLAVLFATIAFASVAAYARAAGRRFEPPATPSAAAALSAALAAVLVAYRIVQQPGSDVGTTVQAGTAGAGCTGRYRLRIGAGPQAREGRQGLPRRRATGVPLRTGPRSSPRRRLNARTRG